MDHETERMENTLSNCILREKDKKITNRNNIKFFIRDGKQIKKYNNVLYTLEPVVCVSAMIKV